MLESKESLSVGGGNLLMQSTYSRAESVYFDAYTGDNMIDEVVKFRNQIVEEATNVHEDGRKERRKAIEEPKPEKSYEYTETGVPSSVMEESLTNNVDSLVGGPRDNSTMAVTENTPVLQPKQQGGGCCLIM